MSAIELALMFADRQLRAPPKSARLKEMEQPLMVATVQEMPPPPPFSAAANARLFETMLPLMVRFSAEIPPPSTPDRLPEILQLRIVSLPSAWRIPPPLTPGA